MDKMIHALLFVLTINCAMVYGQRIPKNKEAMDLLGLKGKAYYNIDEKGLSELESDLLDIDFFGIVISAPHDIEINKRDDLPLLVGIRYSGERSWDYPVSENCFLVATNLEDGSEYVAKLLYDKNGKTAVEEEEKGEKPPGLALASAVVAKINVREIIEIPWVKSEWGFSVMYHDWESNKVNVLLEGTDDD